MKIEKKYQEIWGLAKPYYKKGRVYDIPHIEWMMEVANQIAKNEQLDKEILLPLCILHDIGYSGLGQGNPNVKGKELKIIHMREGAKIADSILKQVDFDPEKTKKIVELVSVHDNWVLGDDKPFKESKEMAVFNDLDFIWPWSSFNQFRTTSESMKMTPKEADKFWETDEKLTRRPLCCDSTINLYKGYKEGIKKQLNERA